MLPMFPLGEIPMLPMLSMLLLVTQFPLSTNYKGLPFIMGFLGGFLGGNSSPLHYSCLESSMDRGAWQATVHGIAKSRT